MIGYSVFATRRIVAVLSLGIGRLQPSSRLLVLWLLMCSVPALALPVNGLEDDRVKQVKTAFIFNIAKYVIWPDQDTNSDAFVLCLYRSNPMGDAINTILGKPIAGHKLKAFYVNSLGQRQDCQVLVIPQLEYESFLLEQKAVSLGAVLTIVDNVAVNKGPIDSNFVMVSLVRKGSGIGFEINRKLAEKAGLRLRADLLKLAKIIH